MRRLPAVLPLVLVLALSGCSEEEEPAPLGSPAADPCPPGATSLPVECGPSDAPRTPSGAPPGSSADIPPVYFPPEPRELASGGNEADPSLTTRSFEVTLPAGSRLRVKGACQGTTNLVVDTTPDTATEMEFSCGLDGQTAELAVSDPKVASAPTRYVVKVTVPAPARWWASVSSTTEPPAAES